MNLTKHLFLIICILLFFQNSFAQLWTEDWSTYTDGTTVAQDNNLPVGPDFTTSYAGSGTFEKQTFFGTEFYGGRDLDVEAVWTSETIDISAYGYAVIDVTIGSGFADAADYGRFYYTIDGSGENLIVDAPGALASTSTSGTGVVAGNNLVLIYKCFNNEANDRNGLINVTVTGITTLYSRQSGNWSDVNSWSETGHSGAVASLAPNENTRVIIGDNDVISITAAASTTEVNVNNTGTLQWTSTNDLTIAGDMNVAVGGVVDKNGQVGVQIILGNPIPYNFDIDGTLSTGILSIDDAATITIDNTGTFTLEEVELNDDDASITLTNNGTMNIDVFDLNGSGTVILAGGSDIDITDDILFGDDVAFTNNNTGTVTVGDEINFESIFGNNSSVLINNGTLLINNRILIDDDDPSITNNLTMTITNDIVVGGNNDDNWDITNTGSMSFTNLNAADANFTFDNSGVINHNGEFQNMGGTESIRNITPGSWLYEGAIFDTGTELYCDVDGINTFSYVRSGAQNIITPQDAYYDITISGTGNKTTQGDIEINGDLDISANINFIPNGNRVTFGGTDGVQTITGSGASSSAPFDDLTVNNTSGAKPALVFTSIIAGAITGNLTLTSGIIDVESTTSGFIFPAGSSLTGSNADSFIDGDVVKLGNTAFEFPTGDGIIWAPVAISAPTNVGSTFTAHYFNAGYSDLTDDGTFSHVSAAEYWTLDRSGSSDAVTVELFWKDDTRSEVSDLADLRVARYNTGATQWESEGQSANSGTISPSGSVTSNSVSTFSPFTFASQNGNNVLPIELLSFSGSQQKRYVKLEWETATELNNNFFTLERSYDGHEFKKIETIKGNGTSGEQLHYEYDDYPHFSGLIYYRLSQTDFDGTSETFDIISVKYEISNTSISVYPNPVTGNELTIFLPSNPKGIVYIKIYSLSGELTFQKKFTNPENTIALKMNPTISKGIYILRVVTETNSYHNKLYLE